MKLISCHVENFGRLHSFDYTFKDGINIFLCENGWGKSTFAAFLCAMFYGLPGARRKQAGNGLRERFRPWQGGIYGGRLIFETDQKTYEMVRVFGRRESEDSFELRSLETNLPDFDFSSDIGRELFRLDRESFVRSVFTAQQDCACVPTDDINALITDLTDRAGDMSSCEAAVSLLNNEKNRLSPERKTGSLYRRAEEIRRLRSTLTGGQDLPERLRRCEMEQLDAAQEEKALEKELQQLETEMADARRNRELLNAEREQDPALRSARRSAAASEVRERLEKNCQYRRNSVLQAASFFPARIPSRAEVESCLGRCRELERLEERIRERTLSPQEQQLLTRLEQEQAQPDGKRQGLSSAPVLIASAALFAAGALVLILKGHTAPAVICIAAIVLISALVIGRYFYSKNSSSSSEYERLLEKEKKLEETYAAWTRARRPIRSFLGELDMEPGDDLRLQLEQLRDAADDYEDACTLLREAEEELRAFDAETAETANLFDAETAETANSYDAETSETVKTFDPIPEVPPNAMPNTMPGSNAPEKGLVQRIQSVHTRLLGCRETLADKKREMEELQAELEERGQDQERLKTLLRRQEEEEAAYRQVCAAASLLLKARESLTARYSDPIRAGFSRYWETITSRSAAGVYLDANSAVTVDEMGRQRPTDLLSTGYQDLAGICLRIALADAMYPFGRSECPPLILDDPFTNLDDEKTAGAMRLLKMASERYQIIYFTCSKTRCP